MKIINIICMMLFLFLFGFSVAMLFSGVKFWNWFSIGIISVIIACYNLSIILRVKE